MATTDYRLYRIDEDGHILGPAEVISCSDDAAAMAQAKKYARGVAIEVWDGARKVASFPLTE